MATKFICDICNTILEERAGGVMRFTYADGRRGALEADLCDDCAAELPGRPVAKKGRPLKQDRSAVQYATVHIEEGPSVEDANGGEAPDAG